MVDWLTCIDCPDGQLDSVLALALRDYVGTVRMLAGHLLNGPGASRLASFDEASARVHRANVEYALARREPLPIPVNEFVALYHTRYERVWRMRAALALGAMRVLPLLAPLDTLHAQPAKVALDSALNLPALDTFVLRTVGFALDNLDARGVPQGLIPVR